VRFQNLVRRGCMDMSGTCIAEWGHGPQDTGRQAQGDRAPQKNAKKMEVRIGNWNWLWEKKIVLAAEPRAQNGGEPKYYRHLIIFLMYLSGILKSITMKGEGLTVKNGRLINNRPVGETGIAEAARLRKQMKHRYKAECIADGIGIAERRKEVMRIF
jgi:hypothetical protein